MESRVFFNQLIENDTSLNESIRERMEHNLKYNDDAIFDGLDIFADVSETNKKVEGAKDKFNAKSMLGTPIWMIQVSDDEDDSQHKVNPNQLYSNADHDHDQLSKEAWTNMI